MEHFHLYAGNDLKLLAGHMMDAAAASPPDGVFAPERVVVQSQGMQLWLSQFIARRRGICANVRFEHPDAFLQSLYHDIPGFGSYRQEDSGWERTTLAWIIMRLVPPLLADERFRVVRSYLQLDASGVIDTQKLFQLSVRIADVFDQYMIFRPDRVRKWEDGRIDDEADEDAIWQALLWREVADDDYGGRLHRARIQQELVAYLESLSDAPVSFPRRVTIFGISYLPRYYVDVLLALSKHIEVHCFVINPSIQYWSDAATPRQQRVLAAHGRDVSAGNILLSSLAVEGRDFFEMLIERGLDLAEAGYAEPPCDTLLHCVQNDLYHYRDAHSDPDTGGHAAITDGDRSIVIQNCHSRLREMEVLHDSLLSMFESDVRLAPSDVIVMAPAIEDYAPYIEAVFTAGGSGRIPFSIADRPLKSEYKITQALMALLRFPRTRYEAPSVMELLEFEHIASKFGFTPAEIGSVRMWIRDARIRWGLDREDAAARYELPIDEVNTWRYGLDRMLLGYAFPSNGDTRMFAGILPFDTIEGSDTVVLAKLLEFFELLARTEKMLRESRPLEAWSISLQETAEAFFAMTYEESGIILPAIGELAHIQSRSGFDEPVDIDKVIGVLNGSFVHEGREARFMRGGVTFCSLLPMRSIPSPVICLIGMNHGDFPRRRQTLGFDEMVKHPRPGDRSKRNDDRYMFLEAILSAGRQLYVSYCGQNQRDNAAIPPSVVVSELLDYIENNFPEFDPRRPSGQARSLVTVHKLQAFNPVYFSGESTISGDITPTGHGASGSDPSVDGAYFSYSQKYARAATAAYRGEQAVHPFIETGLAPMAAGEHAGVELADLIRFFRNPSEYFLRRRLQVTFPRRDETIEESELFSMGALDAYVLKQRLLAIELDGGSARGEYERVSAAGLLPHGSAGSVAFFDMCAEVERFAAQVAAMMREKRLPDLKIDLPLERVRLSGTITNVYEDAVLFYRMAVMKPNDLLSAWICHLALLASAAPGYPKKTVCCSFANTTMATRTFAAVDDPRALLNDIAALYGAGQTAPLKFFPLASKRYADEIARPGRSEQSALDAARRAWRDSYSGAPAEADNAYIRQCFQDADPFDDEFAQTAERIYRPIMQCAGPENWDEDEREEAGA